MPLRLGGRAGAAFGLAAPGRRGLRLRGGLRCAGCASLGARSGLRGGASSPVLPASSAFAGLRSRLGLRALAARADLVDPHAGQVLAMAGLATVLGLLLELEDDELRAERLAEDGAADLCALDGRSADGDFSPSPTSSTRSNVIAHPASPAALDDELASGFDAILLPAAGHDGVHGRSWVCVPRREREGGDAHETGRVLSPRDAEVYRAIGGVSTNRSRVRTARRAAAGRGRARRPRVARRRSRRAGARSAAGRCAPSRRPRGPRHPR